ncbi:MAG: hypothetical protein HN712_10225 [Gemmatimonadetes bacterium]|jgi:hypothetical protein|nr:hypothetical protein [Gemmatimonadota bacterium]MBT6146905.1 hypothetical protein [Gemmatimonadota bacterium]MBT7860679.1 hypothetical protein [Gemmatimonadota bacterium]
MALGFLYTCSGCRKRFKVYVPKQTLFRNITGETVDWERIDRREEEEGGVEEMKRQANGTQSSFIDIRGGERLQCPTCNHEVNLLRHFRTVMTGLMTARMS